jgi:hypothetical protein
VDLPEEQEVTMSEEFGPGEKYKILNLVTSDGVIECKIEQEEKITYPCIVITGFEYEIEYDYLKEISISKDIRPIAVYIVIDSFLIFVCIAELTHTFLLNIKCLGNYGLYLFNAENECFSIDTDNYDDIIKFII